MKINSLILDSDGISLESFLLRLKQIFGAELAKPTVAPDRVTFLKAIKNHQWNIVLVNFSSNYFCNLNGKTIENFINEIKRRQPKMSYFVGTTGSTYQANLLQKFGIHVVFKKYDEELIDKVFGVTTLKPPTGVITIESIRKIVSDYLNVPYDKIAESTRKREVVQARQVVMFFAKIFTKHSLKSISEELGGKEHTRVIYSCQVVKDLMDTDALFKEQVQEIHKLIAA